jgi:hypothetical protein
MSDGLQVASNFDAGRRARGHVAGTLDVMRKQTKLDARSSVAEAANQ